MASGVSVEDTISGGCATSPPTPWSGSPSGEGFAVVVLPSSPAKVRQLLGRPGEVWGAESGVDKLVVVPTG
jgi:hypothetical protein